MSVVVTAVALALGQMVCQDDDEPLEDDQEEVLLLTLRCFETVLHPLYHLFSGHIFWLIIEVKAIPCLDMYFCNWLSCQIKVLDLFHLQISVSKFETSQFNLFLVKKN